MGTDAAGNVYAVTQSYDATLERTSATQFVGSKAY